MKWLKRVLLVFLMLAVAATLLVVIVVNPFGPSPLNDYQADGQLSLDGITQPVRICRDKHGMAYIYAENMDDLLMAQGFACARDRLFQMELTKRFAAGRIGELAGAAARSIDVRMRTLGFRRQAQKHVMLLNGDTKKFLQKYVDGINAFIRERPQEIHLEFKLAGIEPEMWRPEDALSILYFMGWNSAANLRNEIVAQMLIEKLGLAKASEIFPLNINPAETAKTTTALAHGIRDVAHLGSETLKGLLPYLPFDPLRVGSNNWVVGPGRSVSGKPILANDPHLAANMLPGPWYPSALILPHNRAVGVTIAGTPGIVIGRTRHLAFGVTNSYGDAQDLYVETIDPQQPDHYLEGNRSIAFETLQETLKFKDNAAPDGYRREIIQIRSTRRGPVVSDVLPPLKIGNVLTVRWTAFESMGPYLGFDRFLTCANADEFRQALRSVNQIALNYVFADVDGNIGWQTTGRMPVRSRGGGELPYVVRDSEDNWQGWIPFEQMPHALNPSDGWVGTTNHKTTAENYPYYYSNYFASCYRQLRLMQIMTGAAKTTADDHWQFQRDTVNMKARQIAPAMAEALLKYRDTAALGRILGAWDATDRIDQPAPTLFHSIFNEFARLVYVDELGADVTHAMLENTYFWEQRLTQMIAIGRSQWFDNIETPDTIETFDSTMHQAALNAADRLKKTVGGDPTTWLWGRCHRYEFVSPIARKGLLKRWLGGGSHPANGSGDTLRRSKFPYDDISTVDVMASLRTVVDLADPDKIPAVLPGGVTGRQFDPHTTDQIAPFLNGEKVYWWFSDKAIESQTQHTFILKPKAANAGGKLDPLNARE